MSFCHNGQSLEEVGAGHRMSLEISGLPAGDFLESLILGFNFQDYLFQYHKVFLRSPVLRGGAEFSVLPGDARDQPADPFCHGKGL